MQFMQLLLQGKGLPGTWEVETSGFVWETVFSWYP
jgi:hypothetical protein